MAKVIIVESPPPGPAPTGTVLLYARDGHFVAVDDTGAEVRVPTNMRYEIPTGVKDGVNATFALASGRSYFPDSLVVYLNGLGYNPASITKIGPPYQSFTIVGDNLPDADDDLMVSYAEI